MPKDSTKILTVVCSKIEAGVSAAGAEPASYTEVGFPGEAVLKITLKKNTYPVGDGSELQKGYDASVSSEALEILNITTIETLVKNVNIWLKLTPMGTPGAANPYVRVKNFIGNVEADLDLAVKGKSAYTISGSKFVTAAADFFTTLGT